MANMQEIKARIKSVEETRKITNAMYLIASNEMHRAKDNLDRTKAYFDAIRTEIKRIFRSVEIDDNPYFYPEDVTKFINGTYAILIITSDKGLAGSYNQDVIKEAMKLINEHKDVKLFVIGEYGRQYFRNKGIPMEAEFKYTPHNPTLEEAREIAEILLEEYGSKRCKKIFAVYTNIESRMKEAVISTRLLPFHRTHFDDKKKEKEILHGFKFYPSVQAVLSRSIFIYLTGFIYGALVDSFCSEENSRILAMSAANDNAKDILDKLGLEKNKVRQSSITEEITEVSAGAKAEAKEKSHRM